MRTIPMLTKKQKSDWTKRQLQDLAAYSAGDIEGGAIEIYGEDEAGNEGSCEVEIPSIAAQALNRITELESAITQTLGWIESTNALHPEDSGEALRLLHEVMGGEVSSEVESHDEDSKFYSVGETDILTATSVTEAVQEYIDQCELDGIKPSEEVEVYGYNHMAISEDCTSFDYCIEHLIECLDENYGNPDEPSQYELSDEAKALFLAFKKQVASEYEVWGCEINGDPFIVKVADYE